MSSRYLQQCLCCGSGDLRPILDLGVQPPANSYTAHAGEAVESFPLGLNLCQRCWHAQLTYCVDRHALFDRYAYTSGTSRTLMRYFAWFADALARAFPAGSRVLEVAANDGSLIRHLLRHGFDAVGVDPARNVVDTARSQGLPIECGYWPEVQDRIDGLFDVIVCMNVVAHVDDPLAFVSACRSRLKPGGVLMIQPSQVRMFGNGEFDTVYHEHISFFNTCSIGTLAEAAGLRLCGSTLVAIHGDSPIYCLGQPDAPPAMDGIAAAFASAEFHLAEDLADYERSIHLYDLETYRLFEQRSRDVLKDLVATVDRFRGAGHDIVFVGAAAKAMTVINACGVTPDYFLDEAPLKIGMYAPGIGTLIESLDTAATLRRPALFVLTAWNFRHELMAKLGRIGVPAGSRFYSYFPKVELT